MEAHLVVTDDRIYITVRAETEDAIGDVYRELVPGTKWGEKTYAELLEHGSGPIEMTLLMQRELIG